MGRQERIRCEYCHNHVVPTPDGKCPIDGSSIPFPVTIETLPQTVSVKCRECHAWVSATKVKPLTNWFHHGREYAAGLYQIEEHKGSGLLKLKCSASGRVYKQKIRLSEKRKLS